MRGDYIILYIYMVLFMLFNEINASGRTPKFVNVDEDGNLRGETTDVTYKSSIECEWPGDRSTCILPVNGKHFHEWTPIEPMLEGVHTLHTIE
ncbi:hypothetical protein MS3_00011152 [Schistosoma haematobium]|uniref:Uncharacterized protein n=1 Tax=Schistosoma haematobium TaxID=6185 RepID=A0A922LEJ6_SCHHA|nr:hypothetical protein MS3_00011152 [Schistosoma haematobium]KAH9580801.1 hypothetical protein MS3_00011152 [Schistosoma haematobium]